MFHRNLIVILRLSPALIFLCHPVCLRAEGTNLEQEIRELRQQNRELTSQLQQQNAVLNSLSQKIDQLTTAKTPPDAGGNADVPVKSGVNFGKINISGEGGVAFFDTGPQGFAPDSEFRVDEARLFFDAPIWNEVSFYSDVDLATRESSGLGLELNEFYLDFPDVSQLWGKDNQLNFRAGRLNIPFGEEYLNRNAIDDPLISHSVSDLWGVDPGVELYGAFGKFSYVAAVQNGGHNNAGDFDGDKSVAAKVSYDPDRHWHFSVSGMRTGDLQVNGDGLSALWIGNGFFRALGPAATTFHADLVEGDVTARWNSGHVSAFGGYARANDNDPSGNDGRNVFYYSLEAVQNLPRKFYVATRFSQMLAQNGFPIVGNGNFNDYYFNTLTAELWRLSLGLGYRFSDQLIVKVEYSFERGNEVGGEARDREDFFGTEAVFKF
jgi:hypothetical protein